MGNPVAHSRSPAIHARFAELTGQHLRYERRLIALDGFAQGVRDFIAEGGRGCNITVPFKFEAPAPPVCSERVRLAGAANVLSFAADGKSTPTTPTAWAWWPTSPATQACRCKARACCWWAQAAAGCWRAGPAAAGWRAPHHHCQPHRGQGRGAGGLAQRPGGATKSRAVGACSASVRGRF